VIALIAAIAQQHLLITTNMAASFTCDAPVLIVTAVIGDFTCGTS
jgi:hypothetical protein